MKSLTEEMDDFARWIAGVAVADDIHPMLVLIEPRAQPDERIVAVMDVGGGAAQAQTARTLVFLHEPRAALCAMEGWTLKRTVPKSDPDYRRLVEGSIAPSQLPRHKRGEMLILYGETQAGERLHRGWDIERRGKQRVLTPLDMNTATSRFAPLFMVDEALRTVPLPELDPAEARRQARSAVARLLAIPGAATSSREHDETVEKFRSGARIDLDRGN